MISFKRKVIKPSPNLTPLIDMVFLLLIFFLLTANFLRKEGISVHLPAAKSATAHSETNEITVVITANGKMFINQIPMDLDRVYHFFCKKVRQKKVTVLIKADKSAPVEWVVKVMDRAKLAGVKRIFIATEREINEHQ
ncbi:MAG: biopolymer transporter ExbD [Candidatus Desulfofervidaceae bacterium]|nr:biopolymer transporter ExbD [Candidatus Desulfofervidaceae bacterium]